VKALLVRTLADPAADAVSASHADAIAELQGLPAAGMRVISGVVLPPNTDVLVAHQLGRAPRFTWVSPPIGNAVITVAGIVRDLRGVTGSGVTFDARRVLCLRTSFFVETITVDVAVF